MATAVPSRFAVLAIDDDDSKPKKSKKTTSTNNNNDKNVNNKQLKNKVNNKNKPQVQQNSSQPKKDDKKKSKQNKKKKVEKESQQWEQWKEKDSMSVEETYKQQLHEALVLSKLAYEEQKENSVKKSPDHSSKKSSGNKNNKKSATMSLEQFNNLNSRNLTSHCLIKQNSIFTESDVEFFDRIDKETKQELIKNKQRDILKSRLNQPDDDISLVQLKVQVEKRDAEIEELKNIIEALRNELSQVKERNKKLCNILAVGEMKDKASVIAEVSKLQEIRDELTSEVSLLHAQLEQERSKTRASSADLKNTKNKKKVTNDTA
ncbi:GSCOCG00009077001-RA-CDS [Cotesia congregata]|nr:GSCOCG00009077001-RA-CDS [Cotesia congregata]